MKKTYIICFLLLGIVFSAVYYTSYQITMKKVKSPEEQNITQLAEIPTTEEKVDAANKVQEDIITRRTTYILETYNMNEDTISQETISPPIEVLGYNRKRMAEYIQEYMENMDEAEREAGLISYELTAFSGDSVIIRKTYYKPEPDYMFYLDVQMGRIVVYQAEDDTLYAYTEVKFNQLPEEVKQEVLEGKYIETVEELYHFLESYSS